MGDCSSIPTRRGWSRDVQLLVSCSMTGSGKVPFRAQTGMSVPLRSEVLKTGESNGTDHRHSVDGFGVLGACGGRGGGPGGDPKLVWSAGVDQGGGRPILSLGRPGEFDDTHIFAPAVIADEQGKFLMWYPGSQGKPSSRWFRLGLATSEDGRSFKRSPENPVLKFDEEWRSVLTPAVLRNPDGSLLRENGSIRLFFSSARLGKSGLHTLHDATSVDGVHWSAPSPALLENAYASTVLKTERGYEMWYTDVVRRPWLIRHAVSVDGKSWTVDPRRPCSSARPGRLKWCSILRC